MEEQNKFILPPYLINTVAIVPSHEKLKIKKISLEGVNGSRVDPTKYRNNGHWIFPEILGISEYIGFIYIIRDVEANKLYLGKKQFRSKVLESGTTRRVSKDLNWPWYISSSKELSVRVKRLGKQYFEFIALEQYKTKATLSYAETWSLIICQSSFYQDIWYNRLINGIKWIIKEPITQRHKDRLSMMLKAVNFKGDIDCKL